MAAPLADSKFLVLVFLKRVCGLALYFVRQDIVNRLDVGLLLHGMLVAEGIELLCSGRHDLVRWGDVLLWPLIVNITNSVGA